MRTFADNMGRTWSLALTVAALSRVKGSAVAVNLCDLHEGDPPLVIRLERDLSLLADVTFEMVREQAEKSGLTRDQYMASLDGPACGRMAEAFWAELADFFRPCRPQACRMIEELTARAPAVPPASDAKDAGGGSGT